MRQNIENILLEQKQGSHIPFVIIDKSTGTLLGRIGFWKIDKKNQRVEIGTWIRKSHQKTHMSVIALLQNPSKKRFLQAKLRFEPAS